jgi:hypothetical protein
MAKACLNFAKSFIEKETLFESPVFRSARPISWSLASYLLAVDRLSFFPIRYTWNNQAETPRIRAVFFYGILVHL